MQVHDSCTFYFVEKPISPSPMVEVNGVSLTIKDTFISGAYFVVIFQRNVRKEYSIYISAPVIDVVREIIPVTLVPNVFCLVLFFGQTFVAYCLPLCTQIHLQNTGNA